MNGAPQTDIPDWMRARVLNFKRAMPDRVILRGIKQEEILSTALAVHKARAEGRLEPEIQDGIVRDMAGALGYWLDLKLKTDNVPKDKAHNRRFAGEVAHDLHAIEENQHIRDRLGLPITAGLGDVDKALSAMTRSELLRFLDEGQRSTNCQDSFTIATAIRGQALDHV
jgi:hypothetical protein